MIDNLFNHFRRRTETDTAAALLTLAAILHGQQDRMLTVKEAAAVLQCSTDAVYQMCASGNLSHKRIGKGGTIRIPESAARSA